MDKTRKQAQKATRLVKKTDRTYTYADYLTWNDDERWELIDGVAYAMVPAPSIEHQRISGRIYSQLTEQLPEEGPYEAFYSPMEVLLPDRDEADEEVKTVVQPDLLVIGDKKGFSERFYRGVPTLIAEVLSPRTAIRDYREKLALYERHGVKEYWIVDPMNLFINAYVLLNGSYAKAKVIDEGVVDLQSLPGVSIDTSKFFPPKSKLQPSLPDVNEPPAHKDGKHYTYGEYYSWNDDKRWEIIDGVLYSLATGNPTLHQEILQDILVTLIGQLMGDNSKKVFNYFDVILPRGDEPDEEVDTVVQPDIMIFTERSKLSDRNYRGAPAFIAEITSPRTAITDRCEKLKLYERHGVGEYWIVDPYNENVFVYVLDDGKYGEPKTFEEGVIRLTCVPGLTYDLSQIFPPRDERQ